MFTSNERGIRKQAQVDFTRSGWRQFFRLNRSLGARFLRGFVDLTPAGIIRDLKLNRPIYSKLACYGHFGRTELELPWEKINRKYELLSAALKQSVRQ